MGVQNARWRELLLILGMAFGIIVLARVPFVSTFFYPFRLFGTFIHELSHGLAAIATGGSFQRFAVSPDLSGVAWSAGGVRWIISSAGYVGSAFFGGVLCVLWARGVPAKRVLYWLGVLLGLLCFLFVRNLFGIVAGALLAGTLILAAQRLNARWANGLLLFLAVQMMLDSINSLLNLVQVSAGTYVLTDAQIMAQTTGVPAVIWAVLWTLISMVALVLSLRAAYRIR